MRNLTNFTISCPVAVNSMSLLCKERTTDYGCVYHDLQLKIGVPICTYRTPLHERDLRDVAFIVSSRVKIKALSLCNCFAPFDPGSRQFLGGHLERVNTHACTITWHSTWRALFFRTWMGRSDLYVGFKTALRVSSLRNAMSHLKHTFLGVSIYPYLKTFEKGFAFITLKICLKDI